MFKSFIIASLLLIASSPIFADYAAPDLYSIRVENKSDKVDFSVSTTMGRPIPISIDIEENLDPWNCHVMAITQPGDDRTKPNPVIDLSIIKQKKKNVQATLYPMSIVDDKVKLMVVYTQDIPHFSDTATQVSDKCHFVNATSTVNNVQWLGEVVLDKRKAIHLNDDESIIVTVEKVKNNDKLTKK